MTGAGRLSAFGLEIECDFPLPGMVPRPPAGRPLPALRLSRARIDELSPLIAEERVLRWLHVFDGRPYAMLEGPTGDVLVVYGSRAIFHLSADHRLLRCAVADEDEIAWQRVLLDTVLWTTSLLHGFALLHASAVETPAGALAFVGVSGGGKTSLAAECVRRGAGLFCDDILALERTGESLVARPGPPLMTLPRALAVDPLPGAAVIADCGDERWVRVDRPPSADLPLAAVVMLNRAAGEPARCEAIPATTMDLLAHGVWLSGHDDGERRRFELFGLLAATTPVLALTADPSVTPAQLADLVDAEISLR